MVSAGIARVGSSPSTITSPPLVPPVPGNQLIAITPQILFDSYVNFDVKYTGLIPEIQSDMDPTGRTDFLKVLDQGKKDGHIPGQFSSESDAVLVVNAYSIRILARSDEETLLCAPVHMLASVGFVKEDGFNILGIKIGEVGGNESISDLAVLCCSSSDQAELICRILGQCFQLVYTQATMQYFNDKKESEGLMTNISGGFGDPTVLGSPVASTSGTPEGPSFISGSRTDLNRMQQRRPKGHSSTPSESDRLSSQAADLIQDYMRMLHALLSPEELKQFAILLKRWRSDHTPFSEFIQKVLELYGSERKHLLARMRTFISDSDIQYFESFLEQSGITDNAECSLASTSPAESEGAISRVAESSVESTSAWNSMRLHMTPPIPPSQPPQPMIEEEFITQNPLAAYDGVRPPPRRNQRASIPLNNQEQSNSVAVEMNSLGEGIDRMEIDSNGMPQREARF